MEKINANLLAKIRTAAFPDDLSAVALRLSVAKNVFAVAASLYFTLYLFAVGGFEPALTGRLSYLAYPAFLLAAHALAYELASYSVKVYAEEKAFLRYVALAVVSVSYLAAASAHFGIL